MKNVFEQLAETILFSRPSLHAGEFNNERMYSLRDQISNGLEIEDPTGSYSIDDKIISTVGFLKETITEKEAKELLLKS